MTFGTDYDQISYYDPATSTWKHFVNDSDFNDFSSFEFGKSYEVYVKKTGGVSFTVTGKSTGVDITHQIKVGENFISPAVTASVNVTTVLSGLTQGTHYSDVKRLNASTGTLESYVGGAFTQFEVGKGYIIVGLTNASFSYGKKETTTSFTYDSTGARVKKTVGSTTTVYLGKDYEITGSTTTKHIFLGDRRITTKKSTGEISFIHDDHISSSNVVTDASGNQSALYEYDPYGATVTHTGIDLKHQFTGQEKDDSTGLHYYNARYYDSQLGRFITADPTIQHPTDPQDFNRYAYARNNPIRFMDSTGFGFWSKFFAVVFAVAAIAVTGATGLGAVLVGALAGALGGLAGAAIEKSNLARGAFQGAVIGAAVGAGAAAQGAGGAGGSGGGGDLGGLSSAFRPEQSQGYIFIDGSAIKEGTWDGLKSLAGKGLGLTKDALKAVGSQLATPQAFAQGLEIGINTIAPTSGGLNSTQQLSRFKEDSKSEDENGGRWFRHYTSFDNLRLIKATGYIKPSFESARALHGYGVYLTEPGLIDPQVVDPASSQTYIDVFVTNEEIETSITAIEGTAEYLYHDKATGTPKNLEIRSRPTRSGPDK